jgi:hypothetical protein
VSVSLISLCVTVPKVMRHYFFIGKNHPFIGKITIFAENKFYGAEGKYTFAA